MLGVSFREKKKKKMAFGFFSEGEAPICMLMKARALRVSAELRAMLLKVLVSKDRTAVASGIMNGTAAWSK